ncbi:DUF421 domain-containing protein [Polaribacter vadi]|uniref:YetF C-terminal domain-containing protein n=1 Tax=Polaribacter vadi TaxID=1774273 RepID=A0A1B8TY27_9FLAO|nr:YetF domain-containing protein [Polaribacter vadi]AOW16577.1 DUF421 domain-containing protein [Polaribacter vadi]OBY64518.1 hypothetical protein LPB3_09060 [Polaribacter vadi]|tara:strand:+ start:330 stop:839 length:510 start_codon:yes stop_codon:yes gene_type:complete
MTLQEIFWLVVSVLGVFSIIIAITRVFGLRTFAKMSSFDFASTIAVGSVLASVILNTDYSLLKGAVVLVSIIGFQTLFSFLVRKVDIFKELFTNKPQIIMWNGKILYDKLKKCNVGEDDLIAKLREANVHDFNEVKAAVFESTGDVSVIHNKEDKEISLQILTDVSKDI